MGFSEVFSLIKLQFFLCIPQANFSHFTWIIHGKLIEIRKCAPEPLKISLMFVMSSKTEIVAGWWALKKRGKEGGAPVGRMVLHSVVRGWGAGPVPGGGQPSRDQEIQAHQHPHVRQALPTFLLLKEFHVDQIGPLVEHHVRGEHPSSLVCPVAHLGTLCSGFTSAFLVVCISL